MGCEKWLIAKALEHKTDEDKDKFEDELVSIEIISEQYKTFIGNLDDEVEKDKSKKLKWKE